MPKNEMRGQHRSFQSPLEFGSNYRVSPTGLIISAGESADPICSATPDKNFVHYQTKNSSTSGTSRGMYFRHQIAGAGQSGEALRAFTTVSDVVGGSGGIHGAQISLSFGSSGSTTGLGVACRQTLQVPNAVLPSNGTYAASQSEIYCDGSAADPSGVTELAFQKFSASGHATGAGRVDDKAFLFAFDGVAVGAGNMIAAQSAAAVTHTIRVKFPDGTTKYLMCSTNQ